MDNLISRAQMSEAIKDYLKDLIDKGICEVDITEFNVDIQNIIEAQPTSYNVDKVVEEMEKLEKHYLKCCLVDYNEGAAVAIRECMGIARSGRLIKAGGVNE